MGKSDKTKMQVVSAIKSTQILKYSFDGAFSAHINGDYEHDSRWKSYYQNLNWVQYVRKFSVDALPSSTRPSPTWQSNTCFRSTLVIHDGVF